MCRVHEVVSVLGSSCFHEDALHARIRDNVFRENVRDVKSRVPVARVIARCLDEVAACKLRRHTFVIRQLVDLRLELDRVHMILLEFVSLRKLRVEKILRFFEEHFEESTWLGVVHSFTLRGNAHEATDAVQRESELGPRVTCAWSWPEMLGDGFAEPHVQVRTEVGVSCK